MKDQIETFVAHSQTNIIDRAELMGDQKLEIQYGKKYARIVRKDSRLQGGSAWGFVDMTTGAILKAAGWKAPAKNFARGNINNPKTWDFEWTGIE